MCVRDGGCTAASDNLEWPGLLLFGVLFLWQVPHFLAISLYRRDDYERAGIRTWPQARGEDATKRLAVAYATALVPCSLALVAETMTWLGKLLTGVVERFTLSARHHETSAGTLIAKANERTTLVEGTDSLRAETQLVTVAGVASETAHTKVIAAAEDLRRDGKRIAVG